MNVNEYNLKTWNKIIRMTSRLNTAREFIRVNKNEVYQKDYEEVMRTYPKLILELKQRLNNAN